MGYILNQSLAHLANNPNKLQDYHTILAKILEPLQELQRTGLAWVFEWEGKKYPCILRPYIPWIIGDTAGHDRCCCRMESRSKHVQCICRYCNTRTADCDNPDIAYRYTKQIDVINVILSGDEEALKAISYNKVVNAFASLGIYFGGGPRGIHGALPLEILHAIQSGLNKIALNQFFEVRRVYSKVAKQIKARARKRQAKGEEDPVIVYRALDHAKDQTSQRVFNKETTRQFEAVARRVGLRLARQSDRDLPRTSFPQGIVPTPKKKSLNNTSTKKKSASEMQGVILIVILMLSSTFGKNTLDEKITETVSLAWMGLLEIMICLEAFLKKEDGFSKKDQAALRQLVRPIMYRYKNTVRRVVGNAMRFLKFHGLLHLPDDLIRNAAFANSDSSVLEANHKFNAKNLARLTQFRSKLLDWQTARKSVEVGNIRRASREVIHQEADRWGRDWEATPPPSTKDLVMEFGLDEDNIPIFTRFSKRKRTVYNAVDLVPENMVMELLYIYDHMPGSSLPVYGCHTRNGNIFRGNPIRERRDWCMVNWGTLGDIPAEIWFFLDLTELVEEIKVNGCCVTAGVYVLGYSLPSPIVWGDPEHKWNGENRIVHYGKLDCDPQGNPKVVAFEVESISGVLVAVPDFDEHGFLHRSHEFLILAPRSTWPDIFVGLQQELDVFADAFLETETESETEAQSKQKSASSEPNPATEPPLSPEQLDEDMDIFEEFSSREQVDEDEEEEEVDGDDAEAGEGVDLVDEEPNWYGYD